MSLYSSNGYGVYITILKCLCQSSTYHGVKEAMSTMYVQPFSTFYPLVGGSQVFIADMARIQMWYSPIILFTGII